MAAVGTNTIVYDEVGTIQVIEMDWLSDASGDVSGTYTVKANGIIEKVLFISDTGGTAPTDLYDVTLLDENSDDVLEGGGANIAIASTPEAKVPVIGTYFKVAVNGKLQLVVANAGNAKGGEVHVYIRGSIEH